MSPFIRTRKRVSRKRRESERETEDNGMNMEQVEQHTNSSWMPHEQHIISISILCWSAADQVKHEPTLCVRVCASCTQRIFIQSTGSLLARIKHTHGCKLVCIRQALVASPSRTRTTSEHAVAMEHGGWGDTSHALSVQLLKCCLQWI